MAGFKLSMCDGIQSSADDLRNNGRGKQDQSNCCLEQQLGLYCGQPEQFPVEQLRTGAEYQAYEDPQQQRCISKYFYVYGGNRAKYFRLFACAVVSAQGQYRTDDDSQHNSDQGNDQSEYRTFENVGHNTFLSQYGKACFQVTHCPSPSLLFSEMSPAGLFSSDGSPRHWLSWRGDNI